MRARDRFRLFLVRLEEDEDEYRQEMAFLGARIEAGINRLRRRPPSVLALAFASRRSRLESSAFS
jgi:hypothetical protein